MREENQLRIITALIESYQFDIPLVVYLRSFFKKHPQMGSTDRRLATEMVYHYFRTGKSVSEGRTIERIAIACFLCSNSGSNLVDYCIQKYLVLKTDDIVKTIDEKIGLVTEAYPSFNSGRIFPFRDLLSNEIDFEKFAHSFLVQPLLWIRLRNKFANEVMDEFASLGIEVTKDEINPLTVSVKQSPKLEATNAFQKGYFEIQDRSSQQTLSFLNAAPGQNWWDACAGAGGKSLLLEDNEPAVSIMATDSRPSILKNYIARHLRAGLKNYQTLVADVSTADLPPEYGNVDGVIADVPCTGSGTWSRTPESILMFKQESLAGYVDLQRKIIRNISNRIKPGTPIAYITCSVFARENEGNIDWLLENIPLQLERSEYLKGYEQRANTLFAAKLVKR